MKEIVVVLSNPPIYQEEVWPYPISVSATLGPVFLREEQTPKAP